MIRRIPGFIFLLNFIIPSVHAQKLKKSDKVIVTNLQSEIKYLADDRLEGRRAGTPGEKLAADFIQSAFNEIGLQPMGTNHGWEQAFEINDIDFKSLLPAMICAHGLKPDFIKSRLDKIRCQLFSRRSGPSSFQSIIGQVFDF